MGFYSWNFCDTHNKEPLMNIYAKSGIHSCYVLIPNKFGGGSLYEPEYEGYGKFAGRSIYALVAEWNAPEKCKDANGNLLPEKTLHEIGFDIMRDGNQNIKYPIKIALGGIPYESVDYSTEALNQGYDWDDIYKY